MTRPSTPIIVGGCHRSGTSLLRRMLNAHSRIHCGPEVTFFRDLYGDYRDDPLAHLRFFATARSIALESDLLQLAGGAFVALHDRVAARAAKSRWADKAPENVLYLAQWQQLLGDRWTFVHVVRNPLDTLASMKETPFPRTLPHDLDGRLALYERYTAAGLEFAARHPGRSHRVAYETLVQAPERTLETLMSALGETLEPAQLAFNSRTHESGLEDPKVAATARVHSHSVDRWRRLLTPDEAETIRTRTAQLWARAAADQPPAMQTRVPA
jgi:hypothetical protein